MNKILTALLSVVFIPGAGAFELPSMKSADIAAAEVPAAPEVSAVSAEKAPSQHLWMSVRHNEYVKEAQASDYGARIESRVRRDFNDSFSVNNRVNNDYSWASIRKWQDNYTYSGSGSYVTMNCHSTSCSITGNVRENGKTSYVNAFVSRRFDDYSWSVSGSGLNLYTDKNSVNGSYDTDRAPKTAVAAVVSLLLARSIDATAKPEDRKAVQNGQRIWMSIRSGGIWNEVEAVDPWARIEVGLRKVFDREYDAEMEVDNDRQWGRVSNFFTRRYELRAGRTDLRMEEWAGSFRIEGRVATPGSQESETSVRLEMRERFHDDGSFYIRENGIYLNIDRNGLSGEVDLKVYPKQVVASIAALVMTYQQINKPQDQDRP
ncbi:MAG: hypothetical protein FD189_1702 [Elusimicrobia bacterium]|nr:MAG: hypothetical protein FD154_1868 [Elusimicrobiota bacterium]KAF0154748.1 MAG: hypothetical protein FD189_1702 [Elusimicrobiota bacterium]